MKRLIILLAAFALIGLFSFSSSNMQAPDCEVCLQYYGYTNPGEAWGFELCSSWAEGECGYSNLCGPGSEYCEWWTCEDWRTGCDSGPPPY